MRGIASLGNISCVEVLLAKGINLVLAVCFIIILALGALKTAVDLSTNTNTLSSLDECHLGANSEGLSDNLMTDSKRSVARTPILSNGVSVRSAHTTAFDLNIYIVVGKWARSP